MQSTCSMQVENFQIVISDERGCPRSLVKLADRTHNMRTISFIPNDENRQRIARETLEYMRPCRTDRSDASA